MLTSLAQMFMTLSTFKSNQKCIFCLLLISFILLVSVDRSVDAISRCISSSSCMNGGLCINGSCVCTDGWQGDECQFCGGKVRWVNHSYDFLFYYYFFAYVMMIIILLSAKCHLYYLRKINIFCFIYSHCFD